MATLEHCERLAARLGRLGAFVEMSYRLFPETRNSFSPNLLELGFNFTEMRQVTANTELRFQIFPTDVIAPLKKELEDLRAVLRQLDDGPFDYTGAPFLNHRRLGTFRGRVAVVRQEVQRALRAELVEGYDGLRARARAELAATFEALLPRLGVDNAQEIVAQKGWFDSVFPSRKSLRGDFRLMVHVTNVHPMALLEGDRLRAQVERYLARPAQISLFDTQG